MARLKRGLPPRVFTDQEEADLSRAQAMHTRAYIMELGIAKLLGSGSEFVSVDERAVAHGVLGEALAMRREAYELQRVGREPASLTRSSRNDQAKPKRKTRGRVANAKGQTK